MVFKRRLVDFHADDHVNVVFVEAFGDESVDRPDAFDVDVGIYATFGVHDEVTQKVGLDYGDLQVAIELDNVRPVETVDSVVPFDILQVVAVREHFVPVVWVLFNPGLRNGRVSLFESERPRLPGLPDLGRDDGSGRLQRLLILQFPFVLVGGSDGCSEEMGVGEEEEEADEDEVGGQDSPDLGSQLATEVRSNRRQR